MNHLKLMGAMTMATIFLLGAIGVMPASATRLCQTNTSTCTLQYPNSSTFPADLLSGTNAVLTTSGSVVGTNPTITCSVSSASITSTNQGGTTGIPVAVRLSALSFTSCTSTNPANCSTSGTVGSLTGATGQIAWTAGANGTLVLTPPTVTFTCPIVGFNVNCVFGGSGTVDGTVTGGTSPVVDIVNQSIAAGGGFGCPQAANWNARYTVTRPLFVTNN